jgi:two-component system, OmpR family, sensor kinase
MSDQDRETPDKPPRSPAPDAGADPTRQAVELSAEAAMLRDEVTTLREAVAARDAFLAVAAHELRNPMTPIRGRVQFLRRMVEKGETDATKLGEGLRQVERLVEQYMKRATTLLDVSRAATGKLRLEREVVDVCALVRDIAEEFIPVAAHSGSPFEVQIPSEPMLIHADRLALEQVIDNLVSNALKYGAGKPVQVSVAEEGGSSRTAGTCIIRVCDHGDGISVQDQARIFERFERAVRPGEHRGGFGVGLWIVRQLVEAMSGSVEVTSTSGQGSTFTVRLPSSEQRPDRPR